MKRALVSLLAVICICVTSLAAAKDAGPAYRLTLFTFLDPPYTLRTANGQDGLVDKIVSRLMMQAGVNYEVKVLPTKRATLSTQATKDSCVYPIEKSQERESQFKWISPILISRHGLLQLKGEPPIDLIVLNDAKDYRIGSYLGSETGEYLKSLGFTVDFAADNSANIQKLMVGRIDLWASDIVTAEFISKQENKRLSPPRLEFFTTLRAIGCHESVPDEQVNKLQNELIRMYRSGEISWLRETILD